MVSTRCCVADGMAGGSAKFLVDGLASFLVHIPEGNPPPLSDHGVLLRESEARAIHRDSRVTLPPKKKFLYQKLYYTFLPQANGLVPCVNAITYDSRLNSYVENDGLCIPLDLANHTRVFDTIHVFTQNHTRPQLVQFLTDLFSPKDSFAQANEPFKVRTLKNGVSHTTHTFYYAHL